MLSNIMLVVIPTQFDILHERKRLRHCSIQLRVHRQNITLKYFLRQQENIFMKLLFVNKILKNIGIHKKYYKRKTNYVKEEIIVAFIAKI